MSDSPQSVRFYAKLATLLSGIVAFGFVAWAGVVWNMGHDIKKDLNKVLVSQREVALQVEFIKKELQRHQARPWHDKAGDTHAAARREMDSLRNRIDNHHHNGARPYAK